MIHRHCRAEVVQMLREHARIAPYQYIRWNEAADAVAAMEVAPEGDAPERRAPALATALQELEQAKALLRKSPGIGSKVEYNEWLFERDAFLHLTP